MVRKVLLLVFLSISMTGFCATHIITNSGFTFTPSAITINEGDDVLFQLESIHTAVEVNQATYNANQATPLANGFSVGLGGGAVPASKLGIGIHYYVCSVHISPTIPMKGTITVVALGVNDFQLAKNFSVFPNPVTEIVNVKTNENFVSMPYILLDQGGRLIYEGKLEDLSTAINLGQLTTGIYFLQIGVDNKQVFKLIKK